MGPCRWQACIPMRDSIRAAGRILGFSGGSVEPSVTDHLVVWRTGCAREAQATEGEYSGMGKVFHGKRRGVSIVPNQSCRASL